MKEDVGLKDLLLFHRTHVSLVRSMGPSVSNEREYRPCADLIDVTLADEDTNSILVRCLYWLFFMNISFVEPKSNS